MNSNETHPSHLSFRFEDKTLWADLSASSATQQLSMEVINQRIRDEGYEELFFSESTLEKLVEQINRGEQGQFAVAEQRDATTDFVISDDKQSVLLDTTPAYGGHVWTQAELTEKLVALAIDPRCIHEAAIAQATREARVIKLVVAEAIQAVRGDDTRFEPLVKLNASLEPHIDEHGKAELHELRDFLHIEAGTPLMKRLPATEGKPGINVLGEALAAEAGIDLQYGENLPGVALDPNDDAILVATIAGHPHLLAQGMSVDSVLTLKGINNATGNVDYQGAVIIKGDVESGFILKADGDIHVTGVVEWARIVCGGDLIITGGILGKAPNQHEDPTERHTNLLEIGGSLYARYISHSEAQVVGDVIVREYLHATNISVCGDVYIGQKGGKGQIMAGQVHSDKSIQSNILGSDSYLPTTVSVGDNISIASRLTKLERSRTRRKSEMTKLEEILAMIQNRQAERVGQVALQKEQKIKNTITAGNREIDQMDLKIVSLREQLKHLVPAFISVRKKLYPNVVITIDGCSKKIQDESGPQTLINDQGEITTKESMES